MRSGGPSADWSRLDSLFQQLLDLPTGQRNALLEHLARDEPALAETLRELLEEDEGRSGFLDRPAADHLAAMAAAEEEAEEDVAPPSQIGPWRVVQELGRGGMGVVYLGERADGEYEQQVAIKLVKRGLDTDDVLDRFRRERQILAALDHPQIARLLDGGATVDGVPYFAMELVEGEPISDYCEAHGLDLESRLRLFQQVADAVDHAHRKLVVHRDLKPTNVLVGENGLVKLLDFGIAKLLAVDGDVPGEARTREDMRRMTPEYAAPEQILGRPVTTATDVYGLGVLLYELLCGERPRDLSGKSSREIESEIAREPRPPSAVAGPRRGRRLAGDLDAITLKALRSDPARRYPSASSLSEDIQRHLDRLPVRARPESWSYRAGRFVERHRVGVAATLLTVVSLVAGLGVAVWQAREKASEAAKARAVQQFVVELFEAASPERARGEETTVRQILDAGAQRVGHELGEQPAVRAELELVLGDLYAELGLFEQALPLLERAEASQELAGGDGRPLSARVQRGKGAVLLAQGELDEAEARFRRALALHRDALGPRDREVAEDLDRLAMVLRQRGDLDALEEVVRESLAIRRAAFGESHEKVADSLNNLAVVLRERTEYDAAEELYRRALDIRLAQLGRRHPDTADTLNNLAALLYFRGRWTEARDRFVEVTELYRDLYGEEHPLTVQGTNNTAVLLLFLGRFDEARAGFEEVLEHWRANAGEDHPNAIVTRGNLGLLLQRTGHLPEAEAILREVREAWRAKLGEDHPYLAVLDGRLATVLRERGRYDDAEALYRAALSGHRRAHGEDHPNVAQELYGLARLARERGRLEEAEAMLLEARALCATLLDELHPDRLRVEAELAAVAGDAGRTREAESELRATLARAARALPEGHPLLLRLHTQLGRLLSRAGKADEAVDELTAAVAGLRASFGPDGWRVAEAEMLLASALAATPRASEARTVAARAHRALSMQLGDEHPLTVRAGEIEHRLDTHP